MKGMASNIRHPTPPVGVVTVAAAVVVVVVTKVEVCLGGVLLAAFKPNNMVRCLDFVRGTACTQALSTTAHHVYALALLQNPDCIVRRPNFAMTLRGE